MLPLLVIDAALAARLRVSPRRAAFFCAAAAALDAELRERGSRLVVRRGPAAPTVREIARTVEASGAAWSAAYDPSAANGDAALQSSLEEAGLEALIVHDAPAIAPEEMAASRARGGSGYRAFAPYFDAWSDLTIPSYEYPLLLRFVEHEVPSESLPAPQEFEAQPGPEAGSALAQRQLARFLRERAPRYATDSAIPSEDGTSQLSAHLAFGTISARTVARGVKDRLNDPFSIAEERFSLRLFLRALARRDFFLQLAWFHPSSYDEPLQEKMRGFKAARSGAALEAWRAGETGYPLVDAGIRQLHATGWMHPHVRAVGASLLCFDLGVDWRAGRDEWDRLLIEDELAVATGNWQWIAGVGADMAQFPRIYNPERQRRRCDPQGHYIRRWIPELRESPLRANYAASENAQLPLALFSTRPYPAPIVDHAIAARSFLRRYRAFVSP